MNSLDNFNTLNAVTIHATNPYVATYKNIIINYNE